MHVRVERGSLKCVCVCVCLKSDMNMGVCSVLGISYIQMLIYKLPASVTHTHTHVTLYYNRIFAELFFLF